MTGGVGDRAAKELRRGWEWGSQAATADRAQTEVRFLQPQPRHLTCSSVQLLQENVLVKQVHEQELLWVERSCRPSCY